MLGDEATDGFFRIYVENTLYMRRKYPLYVQLSKSECLPVQQIDSCNVNHITLGVKVA